MNQVTIGQLCAEIQEIQNRIFRMRDLFHSSSSQFHALTVAWEALRFSWYAVRGEFDDAGIKLDRVQAAIEWYLETRKK